MTVTPRARIRVLPDAVADQIAAGEVVERPASAVKELAENALDAGATQIRIAVEQGGKTLIEVSDDGSGMDRDDALLALERHATSKISSASDLVGSRPSASGEKHSPRSLRFRASPSPRPTTMDPPPSSR
jgi:DNA mismatch repair ATPase MutL